MGNTRFPFLRHRMSGFDTEVNFDYAFKCRFGHSASEKDPRPFTDLNLLEKTIFSLESKTTNVKRYMGFVEEDCHIHLFIEFRDLLCNKKECERLRKHIYTKIPYLANEGQGGSNPVSITPYKKYRKQEYQILSEKHQQNHQIDYITKDARFEFGKITTPHIRYDITSLEIDKCQKNYYQSYRKIIKYFEDLKVNKKIKNKTLKKQFEDYIKSVKDNLTNKNIPKIVAQFYTDNPQEHTPYDIKRKVYYILSKYYPETYSQLIIEQLNQELIHINLK